MTKWTIWRHGWNAANNSARRGGPEYVVVAVVEAATAEEAATVAARTVSCYHNQYLFAESGEAVEAERHPAGCSCGSPDCPENPFMPQDDEEV